MHDRVCYEKEDLSPLNHSSKKDVVLFPTNSPWMMLDLRISATEAFGRLVTLCAWILFCFAPAKWVNTIIRSTNLRLGFLWSGPKSQLIMRAWSEVRVTQWTESNDKKIYQIGEMKGHWKKVVINLFIITPIPFQKKKFLITPTKEMQNF